MLNIYFGMVIVFLDLNIYFSGAVVNFVPDFIGFVFIFKGCLELQKLDEAFLNASYYARTAIIASAVNFFVSILNVFANLSIIVIITQVIYLFANFSAYYQIVLAIKIHENYSEKMLMSDKLESRFKIYVLTTIVSLISPFFATLEIFAQPLTIINAFMTILFIITIRQLSDNL